MFITVTVNREAFFETRVAMSEHRLFKNNVTSEKTHPSNGREREINSPNNEYFAR